MSTTASAVSSRLAASRLQSHRPKSDEEDRPSSLAQQIAPANAGRPPRLHSHAIGPAWLRLALGMKASPQHGNSFRNFPADLLAVSGIPVVVIAVVSCWLMSMHGTTWMVAAGFSLVIAVAGAALIFVAKLPLYRQCRFFTFGIGAIPESRHAYYRWGCSLSILGCVLMIFYA